MTLRQTALAAALTLAFTGTAAAAELRPTYGHKIDLGAATGVVFYTVEQEGFRLIATLAKPGATPLRVEAVLAPGQSVVLSTPPFVTPPGAVEIVRVADTVLIRTPAAPLTD